MELEIRKEVLGSLRGRKIQLPNFNALFATWPSKTHADLTRLRRDVSDWLDKTIPPGKTVEAFKASDFGLFGATWWPCASYERLKITTFLAIWLFTWDDEIDSAAGSMWEDFDAAQKFRDETLTYVRLCLGLRYHEDPAEFRPSNSIIRNFKIIGNAICKAYTFPQREMVLREMTIFMEMSEREQKFRLTGAIPTVEEFWNYRLGSSAVAVCLAVNDFSRDMQLPPPVRDDPDMESLWRHTNVIISTVNDMLSLKKELARDAVDSLIPLLYLQLGTLDAAVESATMVLRAEIKKFNIVADRLCSRYGAKAGGNVYEFIDGCKYYCTGNLEWSLLTERYGVCISDVDGGFSIQL